MPHSEIASSRQTFAIEPPHIGSAVYSVDIDTARICKPKKIGRKTFPPTAYLLLGFDTEYQSIDPVRVQDVRTETVEAKNDVLSYQYCCELVTVEGDDQADQSVSGIIIPPEGTRIGLFDFVVFAIGAWSRQYPEIEIPYEIYLTGHFTRADLPGFDQFQSNARHYTSNIRTTFVSIDNSIKIEVRPGGSVLP